ncbi:hypothetical protein OVA24_05995 [Luteolibacter sp. SL250]|uniref:hypothetical protein n=1 Tax=Luteolibacter sp. SL250 TaxID=2995170 RepID=UPI00226ED7B1|nr:hypothetical protein [Luteolibacter sp. SL250]WAC20931.1 hypothetical protein OVA24_05995 [Luteolibacter sp. SL250]
MNQPAFVSPHPVPRKPSDAPSANANDGRGSGKDGILAKWRALWILTLRYLWLSFCFILMMAPINYLADRINPTGSSLFSPERFHPAAGLSLSIVLLWLPIAIWLATKMSGHTIVSLRKK